MKRIISVVLIVSMLFTTCNTVFSNENKIDVNSFEPNSILTPPETYDFEDDGSCTVVPSMKENLKESNEIMTYSSNNFTFNSNLLTKFNTVTSPKTANGANEPKFSYNSFLEENVSDYLGELTLNFEDLVLEGRNGLNLRIGRTYQTVAASLGGKSLMILPNENNILRYMLTNNYSTYELDRYNLGNGWSFNFPSVQIEKEYIPEELENTYRYITEKELYYHSGNGEVYQVEFTADTTDSNLKGYYNKDIQFNTDNTYTNGQVSSYYSLTLADKTKQYFAQDGRLIGIVDRFGNTIKFEHTLSEISNIVPDGNFRYDDGMWISSVAADGTEDALTASNFGRYDNYSMRFRRDNDIADTYIMSQPIQIEPQADYNFSMSVYSPDNEPVDIQIIGYDTAYNKRQEKMLYITDYTEDEWYDFTASFSMQSSVRYVIIKIMPVSAKNMYIDNVKLSKPKPLISKITDTIGRTVDFTYSGELFSSNASGAVTLTVTSPNGDANKTLVYNRVAVEFTTYYNKHLEQRRIWYLSNSLTEGDDGTSVRYEYSGGAVRNPDDTLTAIPLYYNYKTKTHSTNDVWLNRAILSGIRYKDRLKVYEYETVRKNLGEDGYFDTLRLKKKYDMYAYLPAESEYAYFTGELNTVNYSYGGTYNGNSFDNETGYPNYTFDEDTSLNEQWTVTKSGKTTDSVTFSNCAVIKQTSVSDGVTATSQYTNHSTFKNSPTEIKNTVLQNNNTADTYILYEYNDWGGISSETKEIDSNIKNNSDLCEKYTIYYEYDPAYHFVTEKSYYTDINKPQCHDVYVYTNGLLSKAINAAGETIEYYYENTAFPWLATKCVRDDSMNFQNVIGNDSITIYSYDNYGLYATAVSEQYGDSYSQTQYEYDYITGDILLKALPDGSHTKYAYYTDGKIKNITSPLTQTAGNDMFYTIQHHTYTDNVACNNYDTVTPVCTLEQIVYYQVYYDNPSNMYLYSFERNYYDAVGNLKRNIRYVVVDNTAVASAITLYYHDSYDRFVKSVNHEGHTVLYSYDGYDRPIAITDSENNVYNYSYDAVNNIINLTLNGNTESTDRHLLTEKYDIYGNVTERTAYPSNTALTEKYAYDLSNNIVSYTDPKGNETKYSYDKLGRLTETHLPNGVKASASYSAYNEPAFEKIFDSNGNEKSARASYRNEKGDLEIKFFNYDKRLAAVNSYKSDAKGRLISINEGSGTKTITYDQSDNPIQLNSGESLIEKTYNCFGELSSVSPDQNISDIYYGYDVMGNLAEKKQNEHTIEYGYSSIGNIMQGIMPSQRTENYTYTPNQNLDTVTSDGKTFDYEYYDTGYVKSITYPNDLKTVYEYDNINRVTAMTTSKGTSVINSFTYTYDQNGNVISETKNGQTTQYSYDSLDRLLSVTYSNNSSVQYEYDALNNRTKEIYSNGDVKDYVYDAKYQLKEIKLNGQITDTYSYNSSGAVISHNNKTFTYNEWDRMTGYSDGTNTYTYQYDTNGIRTHKNTKEYIVDIKNNVVAETDSTGAITDEILWGHQPLARKMNGSWYYYIYNAHGDVVGLVNDVGTVVNTYEYTPWGEIRNETETVDNPIKYAGEYYDSELQMYYLRARYYDPSTGRFTSLDIEEGKITSPLDMNRYVYCRNNPIKYVDPSGESVLLACIIIGAVVGAVAGGFAGAAVSKKTTGSVSGTSVAIGVLGGATIGGLLGWGFYGLGASISATGLVSATPGLYKTLEQGVNFAAKALQHMNEKARQVPVQVLIEAIKHGTASPDPRGGSGTMYYIEMVKNGTTYTLEVLYDKATNMIQHFMYYHK